MQAPGLSRDTLRKVTVKRVNKSPGFKTGPHGRRNTFRETVVERNTPFICRCIEAAYGTPNGIQGGERVAQRMAPPDDERAVNYLLERAGKHLALLAQKICHEDKPACTTCPVRHLCATWHASHPRKRTGPRIAELFCGAGGMSLGFEQAGFNTVLAIDNDLDALHTYEANRPHRNANTIIKADVATILDKPDIMKRFGNITGIVGGPPCQTFSMVGMRTKAWGNRDERMENDPRTWLPVRMAEIVALVQPGFMVMENVAGFKSALGGRVRNKVYEVLQDAGYELDEAKVWAHHHGAPQKRWRYILIALHPAKNGGNEEARERIASTMTTLNKPTQEPVTMGQALRSSLGSLPEVGLGGGSEYMVQDSVETWNHYARPHNERDRVIYKALEPGMTARELDKKRPGLIRYRLDSFGDKYRKLHMDQQSPTIPAHLKKDANSFVHPEQHRGITPREAAILQGFPVDYIFVGEQSHQYQQIGNAVPPPVSRAVANALIANGCAGQTV